MNTNDRFNGKGNNYSKYRPSYPKEYIHYLIKESNLNKDSLVFDVGAGTGILTEILAKRGLRVMAVEPNLDMAIFIKDLTKKYSNLKFINSIAEDINYNKKDVDLITVAQAFHWFDVTKFKKQCKKILKDSGKVALLWNIRDENHEIIKESFDICKRLCKNFQGFSGGIGDNIDNIKSFFKDEKYSYAEFENNLEYSLEMFIGRNISASYAPNEGDENYEIFIRELTNLFNKYKKGEKVIIKNKVKSYIGSV